jgi:hypothetical protein
MYLPDFQVNQVHQGHLSGQMNPVHLYFLVVLLYPLVLFVQGSLGGPVAQGVQMVPEDLVHLLLHHHLLYHHSLHTALGLLVIQVYLAHLGHTLAQLVIMLMLLRIII